MAATGAPRRANTRLMNLNVRRAIAPAAVWARLVSRLQPVFAEPLVLTDLAFDDRAKGVAGGRIGKIGVEADDAPFDAPAHSDDAEIRYDIVDHGPLPRVAHRGAGDAIPAW